MKTRPVLVTGLGASLAMFAWLALTGVPVGAAGATVAALALQTTLGALIWTQVRGSTAGAQGTMDLLELLGVGFAIGSFLSMASGVLLGSLVPGGWAWILPSLLAIVGWLLLGRSPSRAGWPRRSVLWGFVAGVLLGLAAVIVNLARYPLQWTGVWNQYHPDMVFFEALANSIARFGPGDSIFMVGEDLRYHWFSYAWTGQLTVSLGLEPFVVLTRVLPVVTVLACAAIAAAWAGRYTRTSWVPGLAAVLIAAGGYVGATYGTLLNFDSPSQALTTVWLLGLSFALLEYLNGALGHRALWIVGILSVACVGGKANAAIVAIGALGLLVVVGLIRRSPWRARSMWALVVSSVPAAVAYQLVLSGSANSGGLQAFTWENRASSVQGLNLGTGGVGIAAGTFILMLAVVPRWAGLIGLWLEPDHRWSPASVFGVGLVVMGLVPLAVLSQGVNELWFALTASAPLVVISAIGLGVAWESLGDRAPLDPNRRTALFLISTVLGLIVFAAASLFWRQGAPGVVSVRSLGPILAIGAAAAGALVLCWLFRSLLVGHGFGLWTTLFITILVFASALARVTPLFEQGGSQLSPAESAAVSFPVLGTTPSEGAGAAEVPLAPSAPSPPPGYDDNSWSNVEVDAARFLIAHTSADDVIVTDRTSSWLTPALTGRRTFMSGAPYQDLYGRPSAIAAIPGRVGVSQRFAAAPTKTDFDELCTSGVTWGWFSSAAQNPSGSWAPFGEVVYESDAVRIVRLDRTRCATA